MKTRRQYAALPYIVTPQGTEVLLITSRETRRWVIPKGWPKKHMPGHKLAALEAFEEAGIAGPIGKISIGAFTYIKIIDRKTRVKCKVDVYPLPVDRQYLDWPERRQRRLRWTKIKKASTMVQEKGLKTLLRSFRPKRRA